MKICYFDKDGGPESRVTFRGPWVYEPLGEDELHYELPSWLRQ